MTTSGYDDDMAGDDVTADGASEVSDTELEAEAMSQPADDPELAARANASDEPVDEHLLDRLRSGTGTLDPNIVGELGATDVPPGTDPPTGEGDITGDIEPDITDPDADTE